MHDEHGYVRVSVTGPIHRQVPQLVHNQTEEPNLQNAPDINLEIVPNREHFAVNVFTKGD